MRNLSGGKIECNSSGCFSVLASDLLKTLLELTNTNELQLTKRWIKMVSSSVEVLNENILDLCSLFLCLFN